MVMGMDFEKRKFPGLSRGWGKGNIIKGALISELFPVMVRKRHDNGRKAKDMQSCWASKMEVGDQELGNTCAL